MNGAAVYLDASAVVKLIVGERESTALAAFLATRPTRLTSRIATVEVPRAVARYGGVEPGRAGLVFEGITLLEFDERVAARAATIEPASLRTLDAVHLASASDLGEDLDAFVTYDARLAEAARTLGLEVATPA